MRKLMIAALVAVSLSSCSSANNCPEALPVLEAEQVAGLVEMPAAPPPAPRPAPPPAPRPAPPAPKAPAPQKQQQQQQQKQQAPKPAAPKPAAPPRVAPKPYKPLPIYRPTDRRLDRTSPNYNYRTVYVNHQVDHTPLLWMIAMNGMMSSQHTQTQECPA